MVSPAEIMEKQKNRGSLKPSASKRGLSNMFAPKLSPQTAVVAAKIEKPAVTINNKAKEQVLKTLKKNGYRGRFTKQCRSQLPADGRQLCRQHCL